MRTTLDARITALETSLGVSAGSRGGVLVLLPGETKDEALARAGAGSWMVVPGVFSSGRAWSEAVKRGAGEVRGVGGPGQ